jgi:hypothetical protein
VPVRTHQVLLEHNPFGMWQSLVSRFTKTPSWLYHALKRNVPLWSRDAVVTAVAVPFAPVAVGVEAAAGLCRRGGTIAVVARVQSPTNPKVERLSPHKRSISPPPTPPISGTSKHLDVLKKPCKFAVDVLRGGVDTARPRVLVQ